MLAQHRPPDPQPCLFEALPVTEPRRRRARAAAVSSPEGSAEGGPAAPAPAPRIVIQVAPVRVDAAALTNPDLSDLARALADASLAFLLLEAVREVRRRLSPDQEGEECDGAPQAGQINPALLRAARSAVRELSEDE